MAFQILWKIQKSNIFALRINGLVAEWLGRGLQNLVQRFESARDLQKEERSLPGVFFFFLVLSENLVTQLYCFSSTPSLFE